MSIVYAANVNTKNAEGDFVAAHRMASNARTWGWVSFGVGLFAAIIWIAGNVLVVANRP